MEVSVVTVGTTQSSKFPMEISSQVLAHQREIISSKSDRYKTCPLCQCEAETLIHMAWNCCASNDIWDASTLPTHKWTHFFEDIDQLWDNICSKLEEPQIEVAALLLIHISIRRNNFIFQEKLCPPDQIIRAVIQEQEDFSLSKLHDPSGPHEWRPTKAESK